MPERQPLNLLRWSIYVFNSVVNTNLPVTLSHERSTTVSLETCPLYSAYVIRSRAHLDSKEGHAQVTLNPKKSADIYVTLVISDIGR